MFDVSVLIVTYNNEDDIGACLDSVAAIAEYRVETVVVDNDSSDATVEVTKAHPLAPHVIVAGDNAGFGAGMNTAAAAASGEYLLLLNPDAILEPGSAERLVELARSRPDASMVGGLTLRANGEPNPDTVRRLPSLRGALMFASGMSMVSARITDFERMPLPVTISAVPMITGSLMVISAERWRDLGGFDERFFMYSEDTDICARIGSHGWSILVDPEARILHEGGASTPDGGRKAAMMMAGRATYMRVQWSGLRGQLGLACLWWGALVRSLLSRVHPRAKRWGDVWRLRSWWFAGYGPDRPRLPPSPGSNG